MNTVDAFSLRMTSYAHRHAAHCESGTVANMLTHYGAPISEAMAFGLSAAIGFAYLPIIKLHGLPLIAYRMPPGIIVKRLSKCLGWSFCLERFRSPQTGQQRLDELLQQGYVVGLQTSVYWLPYMPEDMRFHFNAHNLLVYGKEGDEYLISDPVAELPQRCASADLQRARFAKGVLAPKGLLYYPKPVTGRAVQTGDSIRQSIQQSIKQAARQMLAPIPFAGVHGMRLLARQIAKLDPKRPASALYIGHIVRMQEEIGTGGAGFRFLYAAFLQEAAAQIASAGDRHKLNEFAKQLLQIGDAWRHFALCVARMVKGRDALNPSAVALLLREQAAQEETFFRSLKSAF